MAGPRPEPHPLPAPTSPVLDTGGPLWDAADAALRTSPVEAVAREDAEIRLLIAALEAEGSDQREQILRGGLVDRVFDASIIELRRAVDLPAVATALRPPLRLVGESSPSRRQLLWRRLAPLAAMAACIALAPLVAMPALGPALGLNRVDDVVPVAFMEPGTPVEPVLAALLQRDGDGAWGGVPMTAIDVSLLKPAAGEDGTVSGEQTTLIPLVESHQSEFSDFAAEFARIREAANRRPNRS